MLFRSLRKMSKLDRCLRKRLEEPEMLSPNLEKMAGNRKRSYESAAEKVPAIIEKSEELAKERENEREKRGKQMHEEKENKREKVEE